MKRELTWEDFPFSEADLRAAAREANQALTDSLPKPEDCAYRFSQEFQRKMERLIRKVDRSGWVTGLQRAACFFLALLLSGTAWLTVDAQAREKVFGWISEHVIDAQRYFHQGAVTSSQDIVHYQIDIPEGYWLRDRHAEDTFVTEYYVSAEDGFIDFTYLYQTENSGGEMYIIDSNSTRKKTTVHGVSADIYLSNTPGKDNTIIWMDPETGALFDVTACMAEDDLINLAESVTPIKINFFKKYLKKCPILPPCFVIDNRKRKREVFLYEKTNHRFGVSSGPSAWDFCPGGSVGEFCGSQNHI